MNSDRVRRVLAPNPGPFTLEGTNTWVVGADPTIVIDPGPDDPGHILRVLDEAEPIGVIALTHRHPDHAPGAGRLADASGAPVHAFRPEGDERKVEDGALLEVGGALLRAIHTPGHSPDHLCFLLEPERALFSGDAVLGQGTSVVDPPDGDMAAYIRSLRKLRELEPATVYPGHGPPILTPIGRLDYYIRHREEREEQVLAALGTGKRAPSEMVPEIYGKELDQAMFPAAARSVLAHLLKLEREGRVARTGRAKDQRFVLVGDRTCSRCGRPALPGSKFCSRHMLAALQEGPPPGARTD
jgi:glyoxylase-like metal-dependent hydrolase (beta-lactamase superfamily II)